MLQSQHIPRNILKWETKEEKEEIPCAKPTRVFIIKEDTVINSGDYKKTIYMRRNCWLNESTLLVQIKKA